MNDYPDITRPDVGLVLMSEWTVDTPQRQRDALDAALAAWDTAPWPAALLSHNTYLGDDGRTVLHYSQWTGEEGLAEFHRTDPPERINGFLEAVPQIERHGVRKYYRYRSVAGADPARSPGSIVVISFETDTDRTARSFIDTLFDRTPGLARLGVQVQEGLLGGHAHISTDGTHVVNYAEFTTAEAHQRVVDTGLRSDDEVPQMIEATPGLTGLGFTRFRFYRSATPKE